MRENFSWRIVAIGAVMAVVAMLGGLFPAVAKDNKYLESYNFQRGREAFLSERVEEAILYFSKEISENPENGFAYHALGYVYDADGKLADALHAYNNSLKYLPKKEKHYIASSYTGRSSIYLQLADTVKALADLESAIKIDPEWQDAYGDRAELRYKLNDYEGSDMDYAKLIALDESNILGYLGLGRNAIAKKEYGVAIDKISYALRLNPESGQGYCLCAEAYFGQKKYNEGAEDLIKSLELRHDDAQTLIGRLDNEAVPVMLAKLKVKSRKEPNSPFWHFCMGKVLMSKGRNEEASKEYLKASELDLDPLLLEFAARCEAEYGDYDAAIRHVGNALDLLPGDPDLIGLKADLLGWTGRIEECFEEWNRYNELNPDFYGGFYRKGFFEDNARMTEQAIEDYSMSIALAPEYAHAYLGRGDCYMRLGKRDLAMEDYKKVAELDTVPNNESCAMYALLALGRKDEAVGFMENVIRQDSLDKGNYYEGACFYSRVGDYDKAMSMLKRSLELGFVRFDHIDRDDDLGPLRNRDDFKSLVSEYRDKVKGSGGEEAPKPEFEEEIVEVPFVKKGGVTEVPCSINGLPLHFVFDTGASDVSMSMVEANFMMKNDYIAPEDILGSRRYKNANGEVSEGTVINLKSVNFGGLELTNVRASVVRNQKAPLLLGQSLLSRLGKVEIDNPNRKLKITHKKPK